MNKEQFINRYVTQFMASLTAHRLWTHMQTVEDPADVLIAAAKPAPTEIAYIAAEAAWQKLLADGELNLDGE